MIGKFTLDNFYKSNEWFKLTSQLKIDRVNEDGELICQHCGKPIIKSYDCICHHTIFLTEENINNVEISLNPDLIQLVHHVCHNKIHNKLGYTKREIFLVYGSPLSGKSEWVKENAEPGDLIVNIDDIWQCVSGCKRYEKPARLNAVVFGVRDRLMEMVKHKVGKWNNCYIVGGFPLISERERLVKELGCREIYIESSREKCLTKAEALGLSDYKKFIEDWWRIYAPRCQSI